MTAKRFTIPAFTFCLVCLIGANAAAIPDYMSQFAEDPLSRIELRNKCSVCHTSPAGGGPRNDFGRAFASAGRRITPELRKQFPALFRSPNEPPPQLPKVNFIEGSSTEAVLELDGKRYLINTKDHTVSILAADPAPAEVSARSSGSGLQKTEQADVYESVDVRLINLPTAMPVEKGSLWVDFTHRFPFNEVTDRAGLFGLDGFAAPSFGFTYGVTDHLHVGAYRSPTVIGRTIQLFAGVQMLNERKGHPVSLQGRIAIEGRDNFQRNFTTSFELSLARSVTRRAQVYVVPTVSLGDRPLVAPNRNFEGRTAAALGLGLAVNVRPSVALMAEANMRLNKRGRYTDGRPEFGRGIHRPVVGFGIQKASVTRKHAFTLTFSNGHGTTFAQRSQTRGLFFADDSFSGMTIGFNLTRRLF
ncbi:MAG: hypothetical protein KIT57_00575 [Blastocatellales bacterium]|nr:hypothetical protein [Blastocatellales bacterium]